MIVQVVRSIQEVAVPVSGSSCANLLWVGMEDWVEAGTGTALQELEGRLEPWYLIGNSGDLVGKLKGITPSFNSQLYAINRMDKVWEVWEIYNVDGVRMEGLVATWWPSNLTSSMVEAEMWERRANLMGTTLRAVTLPWCDFVCLEEDLIQGSPSAYREQPWRGMVVDIWLHLAATLNFTFTLSLSSDEKWGSRNQVTFMQKLQDSILFHDHRQLGFGAALWATWLQTKLM